MDLFVKCHLKLHIDITLSCVFSLAVGLLTVSVRRWHDG